MKAAGSQVSKAPQLPPPTGRRGHRAPSDDGQEHRIRWYTYFRQKIRRNWAAKPKEYSVAPECPREFFTTDRMRMKARIDIGLMLSMALSLAGATLTMAQQTATGSGVPPTRPQG